MIYIVSGFMRTGTSAMMAALIAGGMQAEWSEKRDKIAENCADKHYHPNPKGLYEINLSEYNELNFPLAYQNKLIKVMVWGLNNLSVNTEGYRIILMKRDKEEIRQSYEAFFGRSLNMPWFTTYEERMIQTAKSLHNRKDVESVNIIEYRDLINNPDSIFFDLINNGWNIDSEKAESIIDVKQYRFRKEQLTEGI